jgi:hypothetical protein
MNRVAPVALVLAFALLPAAAVPDERAFAFTYEPMTEAAGETEVELYETFYDPAGPDADGRRAVHQLEVGRGLTERFDLAGYLVAESSSATPFELTAVKLRGRYKALTAAQAPLDVVLYLEGERELVGAEAWVLEEKVIFGRRLGGLTLSGNLIAEQEFAGGATEATWGWAAGAAAEVGKSLRLGAETFGEWKDADGGGETEAWAGPSGVVSLPTFGSEAILSAWLTFGVGFGLNAASDDVRARILLGADF